MKPHLLGSGRIGSFTLFMMCAGATCDAAGQTESDSPMHTAVRQQVLLYVGTYTGGESKGIYHFRIDLSDGRIAASGEQTGVVNPSFLAIHPNHQYLYAVNEVEDFAGKKSGAVSAYAIDAATGDLKALNFQPSGGGGPCHIVVDDAGKNVLVANYGGGSVSVLPIDEDGRLGQPTAFIQHEGSSKDPRRQKGPHAHSINLDAANQFAFAADLGLDKIMVYRFNATRGTLEANDPPSASVAPGSGPRHFAFHPSARFAYVINEMASTVTAFAYDAGRGELKEVQSLSTLPEGFTGSTSTAEVQVHPGGKFLFGSNRGHDSIAIFKIDQQTGKLTAAGHQPTGGKTPRNFGIDPTGKYLLAANQSTDTIVVFEIDLKTGALRPTGQTISVPSPVCVKMIRSDG